MDTLDALLTALRLLLGAPLLLPLSLDKTSLSYASIMGLREDNNITLAEYSWLSSIFCEWSGGALDAWTSR